MLSTYRQGLFHSACLGVAAPVCAVPVIIDLWKGRTDLVCDAVSQVVRYPCCGWPHFAKGQRTFENRSSSQFTLQVRLVCSHRRKYPHRTATTSSGKYSYRKTYSSGVYETEAHADSL